MKFFIAVLLTGLLSFVFGLYLPWWSIAPAAFIIAFGIRQEPGAAGMAGFLGVFILWFVLSWWIDYNNNSILSKKIAVILPLGGSVWLLILVTAFVGGLISGLAALAGGYARRL